MAESRDVDGGIEIGIVLMKDELELVDPLFCCSFGFTDRDSYE